jgi:hypothetical protein
MEGIFFPDDFIHRLSLYLSPDDVMTLCLVNSNFNKICDSDYTWKSRFIDEFGIIDSENIVSKSLDSTHNDFFLEKFI